MTRKSNKSRKTKVLLVIAGTLLFAYLGSYLLFRMNKTIVHYATWGYEEAHVVKAALPEGPSLFAASILNNEPLEDLITNAQSKVDIVNILYFPLRKIEEIYWQL